MNKYYLLIFLYTLLASGGAVFFKYASDTNKPFIKLIFFEWNFYIGGVLYFLASLGTIIALKYLPYSTVYYLSAFTYIWSVALARLLLKEQINSSKLTAIGLIVLGMFLTTR